MPQSYPFGASHCRGRLKARVEDFVVDEELGFAPDGEGEHLFLRVEKRGMNTQDLISRLAQDYDLPRNRIGYSGLKDRNAVTRQWLSLQLPGREPSPDTGLDAEYRVLEQGRHSRKLRPGTHRHNRFEVLLRDVDDWPEAAREQVEQIRSHGFANYFGPQRFGRGDNVGQALRQLENRRLPRSRRSLLISALRSEMFNQILSRRIEGGHWLTPLDGDLFMLRGSHSVFSETLDDPLRERYRNLDISACASLYGRGDSRLYGVPRTIEDEVFAQNPELVACLHQQGAKRQMRNLRAIAEDLDVDYDAGARELRLKVRLASGCYLTSLLAHFIDTDENN